MEGQAIIENFYLISFSNDNNTTSLKMDPEDVHKVVELLGEYLKSNGVNIEICKKH